MNEHGALYNLSHVFSYFARRPPSIYLWRPIEIRVLIMCFDLFAYVDAKAQVAVGITRRVFDLVEEGLRQL